jgi:LytS/YehU family sensor histidine kinase
MMMRQSKNEVAIKMTTGLSDMLRHSLAKEPQQFVKLKEEIELIEKYLLIESERYKERLNIIWEIDESLLNHIVPSMILQPIVENVFKHGIEKNLESYLHLPPF